MAGARTVFAIAAQMMRRILVDAARTRGSRRRGGIPLQVNLDEAALLSPAPDRAILALDEAPTAFSQVAPRQAKVVELRYFGGLTDEEIVAAMKISPRTARRDWHFAKAWLLRELGHTMGKPSEPLTSLLSASGKSKSYTTRLASALRRSAPRCSRRRILNLRREVESLLIEPAGGEFLDRPALRNAPHLTDDLTLTGLASGACLGPYRIESKLGEGGMGEVFRAVDTRLGRAVAIKITREQFNARFQRETRAISSLNHPNICILHDVGPNWIGRKGQGQERVRCLPHPLEGCRPSALPVAISGDRSCLVAQCLRMHPFHLAV